MTLNAEKKVRNQAPPSALDALSFAVIGHALEGVVREMTYALWRSGRSAVLNTARDFSCSIVTPTCELLAAAEGLPIHVLGSEFLAEALREFHPDIQEGDAFLHNDPYHGNTHHADYSILVPVFWEGRHVFTTVAKAHQADCGNARPTTYAGYARDVYEEGALSFPCVRVQAAYHDVADVIRMAMLRIRAPNQWYGDHLATLGAARVGERRLKDLLERYGAGRLSQFTEKWFDYSEEMMASVIRHLPAGEVVAEGAHDPVEQMPDGIPLRVRVCVDPAKAEVAVDLRENLDCLPNGYNLSRATAAAAASAGVFWAVAGDVPRNAGSFRRVRVLLRENCVAGIPRHPASCSVATTDIADRISSMTARALASLSEDIGLAEGGTGQGPGEGVISGYDPRTTRTMYINQVFLTVNQVFLTALGGPATPTEDGWLTFGLPVDGGLMYRDSIEVIEQKYPVVVHECRALPDSEGAGRRRGGFGSRIAFGPTLEPMTVAYIMDGGEFPPRGARGGEPPLRHECYIIGSDSSRRATLRPSGAAARRAHRRGWRRRCRIRASG